MYAWARKSSGTAPSAASHSFLRPSLVLAAVAMLASRKLIRATSSASRARRTPPTGAASHGRRKQDGRDRGGRGGGRSGARGASRGAGARRRRAAAGAPKRGKAKAQWAEFVVDVWITNFNSIEFGIYKHSRNRAKSRQFTTDMDIFAEVIEKGERTGLLGYREDLWKKNTGMDKRLVFKLFNETVNW